MKLCKSHITQLGKVSSQLSMRQTMFYTQLILGEKNRRRIRRGKELIEKAIQLLEKVE